MTEAPVPTETLMAPPSPVASVDAICADYLVERRGFEPLTSAVQAPARLTGSSLPFLVGDVGDSWSRPYQPTYERWDGGRASEFAAALTLLFELAVPFDTEPEQGIAPQLRRLGHRCSRYKTVVLEIALGAKSITSCSVSLVMSCRRRASSSKSSPC